MNGKDFKAWAEKIDDDSEVQMMGYREWTPLTPDKIQAVLKPAIAVVQSVKEPESIPATY